MVLALVAVVLGTLAGVVFELGDRTIFVAPPEAVAEGFVRQLASGRYDRAVPYLSTRLAEHVDSGALKTSTERLEARTGEILDVRGEPGSIDGDRASARVRLKTESAGEVELALPLVREEGVWSIDGLDETGAN